MLGTLTPVAAIDGKEFNKLLTLNLIAQQALIANFDPLLRRAANGRLLALSSSVAREPRAYWGAYAASKAALEVLVTSYGAEMRNISTVRTAILDPGGTRTQMRARAYPGEDAGSIKEPAAVGEFVAELMVAGFDSTAFHALPKVMEKA
jgi:short-subunit dehydrogenase